MEEGNRVGGEVRGRTELFNPQPLLARQPLFNKELGHAMPQLRKKGVGSDIWSLLFILQGAIQFLKKLKIGMFLVPRLFNMRIKKHETQTFKHIT